MGTPDRLITNQLYYRTELRRPGQRRESSASRATEGQPTPSHPRDLRPMPPPWPAGPGSRNHLLSLFPGPATACKCRVPSGSCTPFTTTSHGHQAGSEIYVARPVRRTAPRGPAAGRRGRRVRSRRAAHGQLTWRSHDGVPVAEIVNTWQFASFDGTYRRPGAGDGASGHVLDIVQPHVLHVAQPAEPVLRAARAGARPRHRRGRHAARLHPGLPLGRASASIATSRMSATSSSPARCARCFPASPFHAQLRLRPDRAPRTRVARDRPAGVGRCGSSRRGRPRPPAVAVEPQPGRRHRQSPQSSSDCLAAARRAFADFRRSRRAVGLAGARVCHARRSSSRRAGAGCHRCALRSRR